MLPLATMRRCVLKSKLLLIGLVGLAGCSTSTRTVQHVYWTNDGKFGIHVVHHVTGKVDSQERLSDKPFKDDSLPKGTKAFQVVQTKADVLQPKPKEKASAKAGDSQSRKQLAGLASEVSDLKTQVRSLQAQNDRLQAEMDKPADQKTTEVSPQPGDQQQDQPRLSQ
jgi:hypothetical protein